MGAVRVAIRGADQGFDWVVRAAASRAPRLAASPEAVRQQLGAVMNDLLVAGLTIVVFGAFFLLVRVVEHLER